MLDLNVLNPHLIVSHVDISRDIRKFMLFNRHVCLASLCCLPLDPLKFALKYTQPMHCESNKKIFKHSSVNLTSR